MKGKLLRWIEHEVDFGLTPWYWGETWEMYDLRLHYFHNDMSVYLGLTKIVQDAAHSRYLKKKAEDEAIEKFINNLHETNRTCPATLTPLGGWESPKRRI